jgi:thioredoxin reductase (NADPH)
VEHRQLVIIGGGPAGMSAAMYARRAGMDTLTLEYGVYGGMVNSTNEVENYPGMKRVGGMELGGMFREHAASFGAELREARVASLTLGGERDKIIVTDAGEISADAVIIATGTTFSRIGCDGEERLTGRGVSYCAVCDGAFYQDVPVVVVGGGNAAVEEAEYLTRFASKVYIVHRRDEFRADRSVVERALDNPKIEPVLGYVVGEIAGAEMVERVVLRHARTNDTKVIEAEGVFVFVGQKPEIGFLDDCAEVKKTRAGWILTDEKMETSAEGVFAAGDVRDKFLRQIVTAASDGAIAAMAAFEYVTNAAYLNSVLFDRPRMMALLISSVEPSHQELARAVTVPALDVYGARRVRDKLGVKELPAMVEVADGAVVRILPASSVRDVTSFIEEAVK